MLVSIEYEFVYVAPPKTGTRTLYSIFESNLNAKRLSSQDHELDIPDEYSGFVSAISCRDPYSRFISSYFFSLVDTNASDGYSNEIERAKWKRELDKRNLTLDYKGYMTLVDEIVTNNSCRDITDSDTFALTPQSYYIKNNNIDYILKLENIEETLNELPFSLTFDPLYKKNKQNYKRDEAYSQLPTSVIEQINKLYKEDFDNFGYDML